MVYVHISAVEGLRLLVFCTEKAFIKRKRTEAITTQRKDRLKNEILFLVCALIRIAIQRTRKMKAHLFIAQYKMFITNFFFILFTVISAGRQEERYYSMPTRRKEKTRYTSTGKISSNS